MGHRRLRGALLAGRRHHAHAQAARAVVLEANDPVREREQRMVLGQADVLARLPLGAVLAQDDGPAAHFLPAEALHSEPLGIAVAPVAAPSLSLLVRPLSRTPQKTLERPRPGRPARRSRMPTRSGSERDAVDPQRRIALAMPARPTVVLALLVLESAHLVAAAEVDHGGGPRGLAEQRRA